MAEVVYFLAENVQMMDTTVHFDELRLDLDVSRNEAYKAIRGDGSSQIIMHTCFVPVDFSWAEEGRGRVRLLFKQEDISPLDLVHSLAYLETKSFDRNVLTHAVQKTRFDWNVNTGSVETTVDMPYEDFKRIQYGYGCTVACRKNNKQSIRYAFVYPWIVRAWMDTDDSIFLHGVHCFRKLILGKTDGARDPSVYRQSRVLALLRRIPELLEKFGKTKDDISMAELELRKDYVSTQNKFMQSLACMLIPPVSPTDVILIDNVGTLLIQYSASCPSQIKEWFENRPTSFLQDDQQLFYFIRGNVNMYLEFYNWILSDKVDSRDARYLFLSVSRKSARKKRRADVASPRIAGTKRMKDRACGSKRSVRVEEGYAIQYNRVSHIPYNPRNGMVALAKVMQLFEVRGLYLQNRQSVERVNIFCDAAQEDYYMASIDTFLRKSVKFDPVVVYESELHRKYGLSTAKTSFPVIKFKPPTHKQVEEVIGDNIHSYFKRSIL